jgi:hypothetical protein
MTMTMIDTFALGVGSLAVTPPCSGLLLGDEIAASAVLPAKIRFFTCRWVSLP